MLTRNVFYAEQPEQVIIHRIGNRARVEFPIDVQEIETTDGVQYMAEKVYSTETLYTANLQDRIIENLDLWFETAKIPEAQETTLQDVIDAVDALTDIVLGGE